MYYAPPVGRMYVEEGEVEKLNYLSSSSLLQGMFRERTLGTFPLTTSYTSLHLPELLRPRAVDP